MKNSAIEWTDNTLSFFVGCKKVSGGCANCYMYRLETRWGRDPSIVRKTNWKSVETNLKNWTPSKIFVNHMSDTFHPDITTDQLNEMFGMIAKYPQHTYLILTKRIETAIKYFQDKRVPDNIWIGTSVESEKYMWRINKLRMIDAKIRFVSFEPLLGLINLKSSDLSGISWVIVGGESDFHPRPMLPIYAETILQVCQANGIKFFFKQWGGSKKCECHKSWGCRLLSGRTWDEMP